MRQFWDIVILPALEALRPQRVLEIGVDQGLTTRPLLEFAASHGAVVAAIDPDPKIDMAALQSEFGDAFEFHQALSLEVLPELAAVDCALIDGDHNWFTVHEELALLEARATAALVAPPLIILHDLGWPYGRRDLYYDVTTIPARHRQPSERGGLSPQQSDLLGDDGFNAHLQHASFEGGERNGVLTAVEDFIAESDQPWRLKMVPGINGLGILAPSTLLDDNGRLRELIDGFSETAGLREMLGLVENERIAAETRRQGAAREARALRSKLTTAEAALASAPDRDERADALERRVAELEKRLEDATLAAAEADARAAVAQAESQRGGALAAEAEQALRTAQSEARALSDVAEDAKRARNRLLRREDAFAEREEELERELLAQRRVAREDKQLAEDAERRAAVLANRLGEAEQTMDELRRASEDLRNSLREAEHAAHGAQQREAALLVQVAEAQQKVEKLQPVNDELRNSQREAEHAAHGAQQREAALVAKVTEAEQASEDARQRAAEIQSAHEQASELVARREREIAELSTARARMAADMEESREALEEAIEDARARAGAAQSAVRELRERLEVREIESEGLEQQIVQLRVALSDARVEAEVARAGHRADAGAETAATAAQQRLDDERTAVRRATSAHSEPDSPASSPQPPTVVEVPTPIAPTPPEPTPLARIDFTDVERQAQESFRREYADAVHVPGDVSDPLALPEAINVRGHLRKEHDPLQDAPTVDVVVCVHNALEDVRLCLWSVLDKTDRPFRMIVVNDGSDEATTEYLRGLTVKLPALTLIENLDEPHGYTIAANLGLRAANGDYVVLLNSDTIVTYGWLDRIVACGEAEPAVGILGPLSNAASHQSVPDLRHDGAWSTNPLPPYATPDGIAKLLERVSPVDRPRLPFINGFCYVVKRAVIDAIGYFDEEHFASGYCEENDYSFRAGEAGFELAVVDDSYVFHSKSKSFGVQTRKTIAKRNYEIFLDKHGRDRIQALVAGMESNSALEPLRNAVSEALTSPEALSATLDSRNRQALRVVFVLPGLGAGGSGGSHSIYQEVHGMRRLGLDARVALAAKAFDRARAAYADADEIFIPYRDIDELADVTATADVISATHFKSAAAVAELRARRDDFLPAYYVQDYEPFFTSRDSADVAEAIASYTLIPDCLLFAKTHWLCNIVAARHDVYVAKVEPSIDRDLYRPRPGIAETSALRVAAMVRPRTPRRQPSATVAVLEALSREFGKRVHIVPFGCSDADLERLTGYEPLLERHRGLLRRADVAELLSSSDVFLDLSIYQAFGRTALEAMACGSTAVVPQLGGVWEFLEHGGNGIAVDALEPQQAYDVIAGLVDDRDRLRRLKSRARETGARYSVLRAALSEYLLFVREHARRLETPSPTSG